MAADPALLKRIRGCPFARGEPMLVCFRANGYSLFSRRSGGALVRLWLTDERDDEVVLLCPSHHSGCQTPDDLGVVTMPLDLALQSLSDNPYFVELRQTYS